MKKLIRMTLVTAFAFAAGYSVYQSQKEVTLSDLALENVEALAGSEISTRDCKYDPHQACIALHPTDPSKDQHRSNAIW